MQKSYNNPPLMPQTKPHSTQFRPLSLDTFLGQTDIKQKLAICINAAKSRGESLGHILFHGPPGLGKTTLGIIISREMDVGLVTTSGPALDKTGDLAGILTSLQPGDVLFIDEIHRISKLLEEYLYKAIEDFSIDILLDSGPNARSVELKLNRFTLIGATTRLGLLSTPLRSRFNLSLRLNYYIESTVVEILLQSAQNLDLKLEKSAAEAIASRARGTPRIANNLLHWVRDFAQVHRFEKISLQNALQALDLFSIDQYGLDEMDKKILLFIIEYHGGGPVGLHTLSAGVGEQPDTIADVYEPYLIMQGLLRRTPRGREVTDITYKYLNIPRGKNE